MSKRAREGCGERLFTQRQLERQIAKRLERERRSNESAFEVRDIISRLMKEGVLNAGTYAEAARELYERLTEKNVGNTCETASRGTPCECGGEIDAPKGETETTIEVSADLEKEDFYDAPEGDESLAQVRRMEQGLTENESCDGERGAYEGFFGSGELSRLMREHPELDVAAALSDEGFIAYCERYEGGLSELYEGYSSLCRRLEGISRSCTETSCKERSFDEMSERMRRRMASTSFSGTSASPNCDAGFELSALQRDIARRAGLSYREYADMLKEIPDGRGVIKR